MNKLLRTVSGDIYVEEDDVARVRIGDGEDSEFFNKTDVPHLIKALTEYRALLKEREDRKNKRGNWIIEDSPSNQKRLFFKLGYSNSMSESDLRDLLQLLKDHFEERE
jgi:hypothetical protein